MADYGIVVTKQGFNADTASVKDRSFSSEENVLKVYLSGEKDDLSIAPNSTGTFKINHDLGYFPLAMAFYKKPSTGYWETIAREDYLPGGVGGGILTFYFSTLNENEIALTAERQFDGGGSTIEVPIRIFILIEEYV